MERSPADWSPAPRPGRPGSAPAAPVRADGRGGQIDDAACWPGDYLAALRCPGVTAATSSLNWEICN